jgi:hypothetical protein
MVTKQQLIVQKEKVKRMLEKHHTDDGQAFHLQQELRSIERAIEKYDDYCEEAK